MHTPAYRIANPRSEVNILYQFITRKHGNVELKADVEKETIWATLNQIAILFGRDKLVISRHFKNIFNEAELDIKSVVAKNATTASDGKIYMVEYYNLDAILNTLVALALLIAESDPKDKEVMVALVTNLLV